MDLRTSTSLFCGALGLAIAASILLRSRRRRAHWFFAAFAADVGLWYLAQWLYHFVRADVWMRFTAVLAVLLPQFALHLFDAISPEPRRGARLLRFSGALLIPMVAAVLSKWHDTSIVRGSIFLYVFGLIAAGLISLLRRGERSGSVSTQRRVRFLVFCGALAATFSLADFLWFIGAPLPPVGAVLSIVFLFMLAESLVRERLVDAYESLGLALVFTVLAFSIAGLFYVFVVLWGAFQDNYLNAVLAGIVMMVLFEPLRDKMRDYISRAFFFERMDLDRSLRPVQQRLAHLVEIPEMMKLALSALEESRRVTAACIYLRDDPGSDFVRGQWFGPVPPSRIEVVSAVGLLELLHERASANFQELAHQASERRGLEGEQVRRVLDEAEELGPFQRGVVIRIRSSASSIVGLLMVHDDRVHDAFSSEDIAMLEHLAAQLAVVVDNSRRYRRMQEQARLAALGQMAAGLAHEIKNPLGAIKGAAQLLKEPDGSDNAEFVDIILEEVERLDRVVGSVLDYARQGGSREPIDANTVVERTLKVVEQDAAQSACVESRLDVGLPKISADPEQLRQVLMNLIRNALQAVMDVERPRVDVATRGRTKDGKPHIEIAISDNGPGIPETVRERLFVPFFTTKREGTGLGLAISQRLAQGMNGRIEVSSQVGAGATFTLILPALEAPPSDVVVAAQ